MNYKALMLISTVLLICGCTSSQPSASPLIKQISQSPNIYLGTNQTINGILITDNNCNSTYSIADPNTGYALCLSSNLIDRYHAIYASNIGEYSQTSVTVTGIINQTTIQASDINRD